ncbi:hypothetical protein [Kitasatospora aureofaciens]|uniref:hypothetical protein n=1 Tax=Kitasatospora aureofaciens TaxID=1894 RepID=UPI00381050E5
MALRAHCRAFATRQTTPANYEALIAQMRVIHDSPALSSAALSRKTFLAGAITHTDHSPQPTSRPFAQACRRAGVRQSTSAVGSMLIGLVLAVGAVSVTGGIDPYDLTVFTSQTQGVHAMLALYLPLLLPFSVIALPLIDLMLSVVRRLAQGRSPFAADRGHLHHRLLDAGHTHPRAVWIMYFWAGLIAFGSLAYAVTNANNPDGAGTWLLGMTALGAAGFSLLTLPRLTAGSIPVPPRSASFSGTARGCANGSPPSSPPADGPPAQV